MSDLKTPMPELLPCPFCGSDDVELSEFDASCYVQCATCLCQGPEQVEEDVAINDWNRRASPWQPMETAPKDGTEVLLAHDGVSTSGNYVNGRWGINPSKGRGGYPGWIEVRPTHWMPLPVAPEADNA